MELNQHIDNASHFTPPESTGAPVVDQSANANFALELAKRQAAERSEAPPAPALPLGHMPIPN